ncbi:MAG: hypothetical protein WCI75_12875 [candidate division NC10 bacterium]
MRASHSFRDSLLLSAFFTIGAFALLGVLFTPSPAAADPAGSYSKTCKECVDDGSKLICQCSYKGKFSGTSLNYGMCDSNSIWNDKSKLKCTPRGTFKRSCSNISWNESRLQAVCKTKKGKPNGAVLANYPGCSEDIANCDGVLTCGSCP